MSLKRLEKLLKNNITEYKKTEGDLFVKTLDDFILEKASRNEKENIAFRPSQYYKCMRQIWYFLNGYKKDSVKNPKSERILQVGTALHEWVQTKILLELNSCSSNFRVLTKDDLKVFEKEGIECIVNHSAPPTEIKFLDRRFTKYFPISAMVDGVIEFNGNIFIFEFKTINSNGFKSLTAPLKAHTKQGAIYSMCLEIPKVLFLYLNKDTQDWAAFDYEYSETQYKWVRDRLETIENYYETKIIPPREEGDCYYCDYKNICLSE